MKTEFPGYYRPSDSTFQRMWDSAQVMFDANVLLGVYRYSDSTVQQLLSTLRLLRERLWLPHQAAAEYHRNLVHVIAAQQKPYQEALQSVRKLRQTFRSDREHPFLALELQAELDPAFDKLEEALTSGADQRVELLTKNPLKDEVAELFDGLVGAPYDDERLRQIYAEGAVRYASNRPPGYADSKDKQPPESYGDLVLWNQILDRGRTSATSVLFVTDDVKEDWYLRVAGRTIGPRPELIEEFRENVGQEFYMYTTSAFLAYANEYLQAGVPEAAIVEVEAKRSIARSPAGSLGVALFRLAFQEILRRDLDDPSIVIETVGATTSSKQLGGTLADGRKYLCLKSDPSQYAVYVDSPDGYVIQ